MTVVLVGFGGPESPAEVRPFIRSVLEGRRSTPDRVDVVAAHYDAVGGSSPYNAEARGLRDALAEALGAEVRLALRHSGPPVAEVFAGLRDPIAVSLTPFGGGPGGDANRRAVEARGIDARWVDGWYADPGLAAAWCDGLEVRGRLVMTAHSVPVRAAEPYAGRVRTLAENVAAGAGADDWELAWQSRSGRPTDPWLEPDVCDRMHGDVTVAPIGFLFPNVEVAYDLDVEARAAAEATGGSFRLVPPPGGRPGVVSALAARIRAPA